MDNKTHLLIETIQEITLLAWPELYGDDNKYDLGSAVVLEMCRHWGEEFEEWWQTHDMDWMEENDYYLTLEEFTTKKIKDEKKYLKEV